MRAVFLFSLLAGCGTCGVDFYPACPSPDDPPSYVACRNSGGVVIMGYVPDCRYPGGKKVSVTSVPLGD